MEKMTTTINKMQMGRKPNNKKGFTLVEIIVVLVILAILAAILIPSMVGYINKAQKKAAISEARSVTLAAQTVVSDNYKTYAGATAATMGEDDAAEVKTLSEVTGTIGDITVASDKVQKFTYTSGDFTVTYDISVDGKYTVK